MIELVPYTADLVTDEHVRWLNDKNLMRFSEQRHASHSIASQRLFAIMLTEHHRMWVIRLGEEDIGTISANIDWNNLVADLGILVAKHNGKGYATEAWEGLMRLLFAHGIRKIECGCMATNISMRNLAMRAGMVQEALIPDHFLVDKTRVALIKYGIMGKNKQ